MPPRAHQGRVWGGVVIFAGVDWAETHHDVCVMGEDGTVLEQRRVSHSVAGIGELHALIQTAVGDARDLDLADASVDAVLLLGPLYHLIDRAERVRALRECPRIARPGGPVFAAAISRWAARIDGHAPGADLPQAPGGARSH
jgi:SAM-dependent methyltransferase